MRRFKLQLALGETSLHSEISIGMSGCVGYHLSTISHTCIFIRTTTYCCILHLEYQQKLLTQHLADNKMYGIALK